MDLLQEICKEVSVEHTGIKQEPYSVLVQDTHTNQLQQDISELQTNKQIPKESINTPQHQYATPLDTNPVALQQQLSKMKVEIMYLQQKKRPNVYPIPPGNYRHFRTTDGSVICRQCNCAGYFAHAWKANLLPMKVPPRYQNHKFSYLPTTHRNIHSLCISQIITLNVLLIKQTTKSMTQWDILTHKTPSILIPHGNHHSHLLIKLTISIS